LFAYGAVVCACGAAAGVAGDTGAVGGTGSGDVVVEDVSLKEWLQYVQ